MNRNAEAITIFCSHLCVADDIKPLEAKEWGDLAERLLAYKLQPEALTEFEKQDFTDKLQLSEAEADRYMRLLARSGSLRFELSKYEDMGIRVITRADSEYPKQLKRKLGNGCPPLFYYAGNLNLLNRQFVGYAGSRSIDASDMEFTKQTVKKTVEHGFSVVSGGAKGIDSISTLSALSEGAVALEYISDSMLRKMRDPYLLNALRDDRFLLISVAIPTAGFNVGMSMMRNRYIYAQSSGTVVVRSDNGKGGTWAGATENLKKKWCPTFCRDCNYPGNKELIRLGAIPVNDEWDGDVNDVNIEALSDSTALHLEEITDHVEQLSMFGN